MKILETDTAKM